MKAIIRKIGYHYDTDIHELETPDDHIHRVIKGISKLDPNHVMQGIESISAR
ncbi:transposase [Paraglaciecola sp.]|uniref:transposase n=1 Tax=Paraglaciecola sp. TaxID=1920173 RepID=UPI0032674E9E